jgi:hypothetical protein
MNCLILVQFAVILEGASLAVSAPLFARGLSVLICFSPPSLLAFVSENCYNLRGSTQFLQEYPVGCSAFFPNSEVVFSA